MTSMLFVPANDERRFQKASTLNCRGIIIDLEDAVHISQKEIARESLQQMVKHRNPEQELYVRINGLDTRFWRDDALAAARIRPNGIVVPKADRSVACLDEYLIELEGQLGLPVSSIQLILILETAPAVLDMEAILSLCARIDSAAIGMADLTADLGTSWDDVFMNEPPLLLTRISTVLSFLN